MLTAFYFCTFPVYHFRHWVHCNANDTRTRNRYRKPVPENLYQFSATAGVSCELVSIFFWYRNLVWSRTMFVTKMKSTDWSTIASCVVCLYKLCCLLFYCFKINWGDNSIEKLIQKFCFQFHLVRKTGTSFLVPVFGTGFWCVCLWHNNLQHTPFPQTEHGQWHQNKRGSNNEHAMTQIII